MKPAFWTALAVSTALYLVIVLWSLPLIVEAAGGLAPFDMRPLGYDYQEAAAFLAALSDEGRSHYLGTQHTLDWFYPPALAATFALGFMILYRGPARALLCGLAVGVALFDLLENRAVAHLLRAAPDAVDATMVATASRWTLLKSAATGAAWLFLLGGGAMALWSRLAARRA